MNISSDTDSRNGYGNVFIHKACKNEAENSYGGQVMVSAMAIAQAVISGLLIGSLYSLISMGLALIWGVMDIVNFAHGDFMMVAGYLTCILFDYAGVDPLLSVPVAFAVTFVLGILTQRFVIDRVLEAPPVSQIFATFALLMIIRNTALLIWGPKPTTITGLWYAELVFRPYGLTLSLIHILIAVICMVTTAILYIFITRTYTGIALRATSQNRLAARLLGIDIRKMYLLAFGIGVGLTGIGGALLASFYYIFPEVGARFCMLSFMIVVLGGFGSLFGALVGGLAIGVLEELSALLVNPALKDAIAFGIFILILLFKPTGLFGGRET